MTQIPDPDLSGDEAMAPVPTKRFPTLPPQRGAREKAGRSGAAGTDDQHLLAAPFPRSRPHHESGVDPVRQVFPGSVAGIGRHQADEARPLGNRHVEEPRR